MCQTAPREEPLKAACGLMVSPYAMHLNSPSHQNSGNAVFFI
jgi:hypothetical protein